MLRKRYNSKISKYDTSAKHEVGYADTAKEFTNFFLWHKTLCDELAGAKELGFREEENQQRIFIKEDNFIFGIRRLQAFVINYSYAFDDAIKKQEIMKKVFTLEKEFFDDERYHELAGKKGLSFESEAELKKMYFKYLIRCYEIIVKMSIYLKSSLMVKTRSIETRLVYRDTKSFFDFLGDYRKEISNSISHFVISKTLKHYKKVLGYHFTYRMFCDPDELMKIDKCIKVMNSYIFQEDFMRFIYNNKNNEDTTLIENNIMIKKILLYIIERTNESLMIRGILPKIRRKILIDKTGI